VRKTAAQQQKEDLENAPVFRCSHLVRPKGRAPPPGSAAAGVGARPPSVHIKRCNTTSPIQMIKIKGCASPVPGLQLVNHQEIFLPWGRAQRKVIAKSLQNHAPLPPVQASESSQTQPQPYSTTNDYGHTHPCLHLQEKQFPRSYSHCPVHPIEQPSNCANGFGILNRGFLLPAGGVGSRSLNSSQTRVACMVTEAFHKQRQYSPFHHGPDLTVLRPRNVGVHKDLLIATHGSDLLC